MLRFLSDEWVAALDEAVRAAAPGAGGAGELVIRQTVLGGPDGDRAYAIRLAGAGSSVRAVDPTAPGGATGADHVSFVCDWGTAVAIARGAESAQAAFMAGRLRLGGDARRLMASADVLAGLDGLFATIGAVTDYGA